MHATLGGGIVTRMAVQSELQIAFRPLKVEPSESGYGGVLPTMPSQAQDEAELVAILQP